MSSLDFLKNIGRGPSVIIVTGYDINKLDVDIAVIANSVNAMVMLKPLEIESLETIIRSFLDKLAPVKNPSTSKGTSS
jgi:hypothetical protein